MVRLKHIGFLLLPVLFLLVILISSPVMATEEFYSEPVAKKEFLQQAEITADPLSLSVDLEEFTAYFLQQVSSCPYSFSIREYQIPYSAAAMDELRNHIWYNTPEAFHCYSIGFGHNYNILTSIVIRYYSYADTAAEYRACHEALTAGADVLLSGIEGNSELNDVQKALLLHDRLALWTAYDATGNSSDVNSYPDQDFSAYGALGTRIAVCQGYTMAYMYLLDRVGIESEYCSSDSMCHAWNIVYIDDTPYHVDVTWDDPTYDMIGRVTHDNFLRSTSGLMSTGHTATDYNSTPVSTAYDNAYWQASNAAFQLLDGKLYYIDANSGSLNCMDNGKTTKLRDIAGSWFYVGHFSKLACAEGVLLYSTPSGIYTFDPATGESRGVYSFIGNTENCEQIYGFLYEDGYLTLEIQGRSTSYEYYTSVICEEFDLLGALPKNGWYNGCYYENDLLVTNAWREDESGLFYISADGTLTVDAWLTDDDGRRYVGADGYCVKDSWVDDGIGWCRLNSDGYAVIGDWVKDGVNTYYCDAEGYRVTGFMTIDGVQYQFGSNGALIEQNAVTIVNHPQPVSTDSGNTVVFSVTTQGQVVSYRWQYRRIWKWFDTTMNGYNTDTLQVNAIGNRNGYDYRCVVTFADGTVLYSEPAELTVYTYMQILGNPNDQTAVLGHKGQFTVLAEGEGLLYQWQYKRPGGTLWSDTVMEGANKSTVMIEATAPRDGYQYRCKVTDVTGNVAYSNIATLRVLSFTAHPKETFAANGETVRFTVETSVSDGFRYQWQYRRSENGVWYNTTLSGYNTAELSVPVKGKNGYQYRCVVYGAKNNPLESKTATLHSGDPVVITSQPANATAAVGATAVFTVKATDAYSYQWYYSSNAGGTWRVTTMSGAQTDTLQVSVIAGRNGYCYRCFIKGLDGTETVTDLAKLTVK